MNPTDEIHDSHCRTIPEPPKVWPRNAPSYFYVMDKLTGAFEVMGILAAESASSKPT